MIKSNLVSILVSISLNLLFISINTSFIYYLNILSSAFMQFLTFSWYFYFFVSFLGWLSITKWKITWKLCENFFKNLTFFSPRFFKNNSLLCASGVGWVMIKKQIVLYSKLYIWFLNFIMLSLLFKSFILK